MLLLRQVCADDIEAICGYERDSLDSVEGFDARVIQCLQVRMHIPIDVLCGCYHSAKFDEPWCSPTCQNVVRRCHASCSLGGLGCLGFNWILICIMIVSCTSKQA